MEESFTIILSVSCLALLDVSWILERGEMRNRIKRQRGISTYLSCILCLFCPWADCLFLRVLYLPYQLCMTTSRFDSIVSGYSLLRELDRHIRYHSLAGRTIIFNILRVAVISLRYHYCTVRYRQCDPVGFVVLCVSFPSSWCRSTFCPSIAQDIFVYLV